MPKKAKKNRANKPAAWARITRVNQPLSLVKRLTQVATLAASTTLKVASSDFTGAQEYGNVAALYSEARVLAIKLTLVAVVNTGFLPSYAIFGTDRSGALLAASFTSVASIWGLQNAQLHTLPTSDKSPITYEARATDLEDQLFDAIGSATNRFAIFLQHVMANTTVSVFREYLVEFRGSQP